MVRAAVPVLVAASALHGVMRKHGAFGPAQRPAHGVGAGIIAATLQQNE
jgi:hypothetical protein